ARAARRSLERERWSERRRLQRPQHERNQRDVHSGYERHDSLRLQHTLGRVGSRTGEQFLQRPLERRRRRLLFESEEELIFLHTGPESPPPPGRRLRSFFSFRKFRRVNRIYKVWSIPPKHQRQSGIPRRNFC